MQDFSPARPTKPDGGDQFRSAAQESAWDEYYKEQEEAAEAGRISSYDEVLALARDLADAPSIQGNSLLRDMQRAAKQTEPLGGVESALTTKTGRTKGVGDFLPIWDMFNSMSDTKLIEEAYLAYEAGTATPEQETLAEDFYDRQMRPETFWAVPGKLVSDAVPFVLEAIATGGVAAVLKKGVVARAVAARTARISSYVEAGAVAPLTASQRLLRMKAFKNSHKYKLVLPKTMSEATREVTNIAGGLARGAGRGVKLGLQTTVLGEGMRAPFGATRAEAKQKELLFGELFPEVGDDGLGNLHIELNANAPSFYNALIAAGMEVSLEWISESMGVEFVKLPILNRLEVLQTWAAKKLGFSKTTDLLRRGMFNGSAVELLEEEFGAGLRELAAGIDEGEVLGVSVPKIPLAPDIIKEEWSKAFSPELKDHWQMYVGLAMFGGGASVAGGAVEHGARKVFGVDEHGRAGWASRVMPLPEQVSREEAEAQRAQDRAATPSTPEEVRAHLSQELNSELDETEAEEIDRAREAAKERAEKTEPGRAAQARRAKILKVIGSEPGALEQGPGETTFTIDGETKTVEDWRAELEQTSETTDTELQAELAKIEEDYSGRRAALEDLEILPEAELTEQQQQIVDEQRERGVDVHFHRGAQRGGQSMPGVTIGEGAVVLDSELRDEDGKAPDSLEGFLFHEAHHDALRKRPDLAREWFEFLKQYAPKEWSRFMGEYAARQKQLGLPALDLSEISEEGASLLVQHLRPMLRELRKNPDAMRDIQGQRGFLMRMLDRIVELGRSLGIKFIETSEMRSLRKLLGEDVKDLTGEQLIERSAAAEKLLYMFDNLGEFEAPSVERQRQEAEAAPEETVAEPADITVEDARVLGQELALSHLEGEAVKVEREGPLAFNRFAGIREATAKYRELAEGLGVQHADAFWEGYESDLGYPHPIEKPEVAAEPTPTPAEAVEEKTPTVRGDVHPADPATGETARKRARKQERDARKAAAREEKRERDIEAAYVAGDTVLVRDREDIPEQLRGQEVEVYDATGPVYDQRLGVRYETRNPKSGARIVHDHTLSEADVVKRTQRAEPGVARTKTGRTTTPERGEARQQKAREDARSGRARFALAAPVESPEFRRWFGDSKVVGDDGQPLVVYHGTKQVFTSFRSERYKDQRLIFFSKDPEFAASWATRDNRFAGDGGYARREGSSEHAAAASIKAWEAQFDWGRMRVDQAYADEVMEKRAEYKRKEIGPDRADVSVYPVYLSVQRPFDPRVSHQEIEGFLRGLPHGMAKVVEDGQHKVGNWIVYETPAVVAELQRRGYDGIYLKESSLAGAPHDTIAVFEPTQVKSATGNVGTYDPANPDIRFALPAGEETPTDGFDQQQFEEQQRSLIQAMESGTLSPLLAGHKALYDELGADGLGKLERLQSEMALMHPDRDEAGRLLAPNSQPSKLNENQWRLVRTTMFRSWFGDWMDPEGDFSAVMDKATGEPLVVYHGTQAGFEGMPSPVSSGVNQLGLHVGTYAQAENFARGTRQGGRVFPLFLNIRNPLYLPDSGTWDRTRVTRSLMVVNGMSEAQAGQTYDALVMGVLAKGVVRHDGVVYHNVHEGVDLDKWVMTGHDRLLRATKAALAKHGKDWTDGHVPWQILQSASAEVATVIDVSGGKAYSAFGPKVREGLERRRAPGLSWIATGSHQVGSAMGGLDAYMASPRMSYGLMSALGLSKREQPEDNDSRRRRLASEMSAAREEMARLHQEHPDWSAARLASVVFDRREIHPDEASVGAPNNSPYGYRSRVRFGLSEQWTAAEGPLIEHALPSHASPEVRAERERWIASLPPSEQRLYRKARYEGTHGYTKEGYPEGTYGAEQDRVEADRLAAAARPVPARTPLAPEVALDMAMPSPGRAILIDDLVAHTRDLGAMEPGETMAMVRELIKGDPQRWPMLRSQRGTAIGNRPAVRHGYKDDPADYEYIDRNAEVATGRMNFGLPKTGKVRTALLRQKLSVDDYTPTGAHLMFMRLVRKAADSNVYVRHFVETIRAAGGVVNDMTDVYGWIDRMPGIIESRTRTVREKYEEVIDSLYRGAGLSAEEFGEWLYARHAIHRNQWFVDQQEAHKRDLDYIKELDEMIRAAEDMTPAEIAALVRKRDAAKRAADQWTVFARGRVYDLENNPASGKDWGNKASQKILDKHANNAKLQQAGKLVDKMNRLVLRYKVQAGLLSREQHDELLNRWDHYVPLRDDENHTGGSGGPLRSRRYGASGREFSTAKGRISTAANPYYWSLAQAYDSIERAERNKVGRALVELLKANAGLMKDGFAYDITEMTEEEVAGIDPETLPADERGFTVKIDGKEFVVSIDPDLERAMANLGVEKLPEWMAKFLMPTMQWLSRTATSWNPDFILPNFFRDLQTALINISVEDAQGLRRQILATTFSTAPQQAIWRELNNADPSQLTPSQRRWLEHAREFRKNGGKTGWYYRRTHAQMNDTKLKEIGEKKYLTPASLRKVGGLVEDFNISVENGVRLATFVALRDRGYTAKKAAQIAKNLTVNFNRRGEAAWMNAIWLFFNASAGGLLQMSRALTHKTGRARVLRATGSLVTLGFIQEVMNQMAGDDDDGKPYIDRIPDYEQDTSFIFLLPGGEVGFKMPMAWGYNMFPTIGRSLARTVLYGGDPYEEALRIGRVTLESNNPMGSSPTMMHMLLPTLLKPLYEQDKNIKFHGGTIHRESLQFGPEGWAKSGRGRDNTHAWYKDAAANLNSLTLGDRVTPGWADMYPEQIEHLVEWAGGGTLRFFANAMKTAGNVNKEGAFTWQDARDVPVIRRFVTTAPEYAVRADYWEAIKDVELRVEQEDSYKELGPLYVREHRREHGSVLSLEERAKSARKRVKGLQDRLDDTTEEGARGRLEATLERTYKQFLLRYHKAIGSIRD